MKKLPLTVLLAGLAVALFGCDPTTGSDRYDSLWSPSGDPTNTKWTKPSSVTDMVQFDKGISFSVTAVKDSTVSLTFSPAIYQVDNITSASGATLSFDATITSDPDSVKRNDGTTVTHQFATLAGTVSASGDSVAFSSKPFTGGTNNSVAFSVNPDSCSKVLRFTLKLSWNAFTNGTPQNALPTTKKVQVALQNIEMRVKNISVLH